MIAQRPDVSSHQMLSTQLTNPLIRAHTSTLLLYTEPGPGRSCRHTGGSSRAQHQTQSWYMQHSGFTEPLAQSQGVVEGPAFTSTDCALTSTLEMSVLLERLRLGRVPATRPLLPFFFPLPRRDGPEAAGTRGARYLHSTLGMSDSA